MPGQQRMRFRFGAPVLITPLILCRPPPMGRLRPGTEIATYGDNDVVGLAYFT